VRDDSVRILLPLCDREPYSTEETVLSVVGRVLSRCPKTTLTVMYNASTIASSVRRHLRDLRKDFDGRVDTRTGVPWEDRPLVYAEHDVTVWTSHYASACLTPLMSVYAGTPVVSFSFPPASELLRRHNSVPVPCEGYYEGVGLPCVSPNYLLLERCLSSVVTKKGYLTALQQTVLQGLARRRNVFNESISRILV
jgi:hypothetical protein